MRFARFGVTLEKLERCHLELVRQWRNSAGVLPYMRYQEIIGAEDQVRWFDALDCLNNWYFIAHVANVPFSVFHIKSIDWMQSCGEAGGFVGRQEFIGRAEPAQATLALMDFAFFVLQLKSLHAHYNAQLRRIVRFNAQLGYELVRLEADGFYLACVTAERYLKWAASFRKAALQLHGSSAVLSDPGLWLAEKVEHLGTARSPDFQLRLLQSGSAASPAPGFQNQR